jgi:hypothetical protein
MTFLFTSTSARLFVLALNILFGTAAIAETGTSIQGPAITVVAPAEGRVQSTPFDIDIRFERQGQTSVDLATLQVTLMTLWGIDITERVRPYASREGIHVNHMDFPKGQHTLKITISDDEGHASSRTMIVLIQ